MRRLLVVFVCGVFTLSACDSGGGGALTKAEYIAMGDEVCRRFLEQGNALTEPESPSDLVTFLDEAVRLAEAAYADFDALRPPSDGEAVHQELLSALATSTDHARDARGAAERADFEAMTTSMEAAVEAGTRSDEAAKAYGFEVCGSESELSQQ